MAEGGGASGSGGGWTLVLLRFSVPFLVFNFDTYIFFNVGSALFSSAIALRRKIGVVSHWRHVVTRLPEIRTGR